MQIDMHFYGIYALARTAGIQPEEARIIAHASQFVDDSLEDEYIKLRDDEKAILPTITSHKPLDFQNIIPGDQWKVWIPFHFLPGNQGDIFEEKMTCRKNSQPAQKMLDYSLDNRSENWGPYSVGIAMHVFADSFAHYGFIGFATQYNRVDQDSIKVTVDSPTIEKYISRKFELFQVKVVGALAETASVGHSAVATYPDRPYLKWRYQYETGKKEKVSRNNQKDVFEACKCIYDFFVKYNKDNPGGNDSRSSEKWDSISGHIREILKFEGTKEQRTEKWKNVISSGTLFETVEKDRTIAYDKKLWRISHLDFLLENNADVSNCELNLFYKAAWKHRHFILRELLPDIDLIG